MTPPVKSPLVVRQPRTPRTPRTPFVWQNACARAHLQHGPSSGELSQQNSPPQGLFFSAVPHHMDPGSRFNADAIPGSWRAKLPTVVHAQSYVTPPSLPGIILYGQNDLVGGRIK